MNRHHIHHHTPHTHRVCPRASHCGRDRESGSVVSASEFKSEEPWVRSPGVTGWGTAEFSVPPSQLLGRIVCDWPPIVCAARTLSCARTLKIPYPTVVKEWASLPVVWKHENTAHRGRWERGGRGGSNQNFPSIAGEQESYLMYKTESRKQRWLLAFKKTNHNIQDVKNERFLMSARQYNVQMFGIRCL